MKRALLPFLSICFLFPVCTVLVAQSQTQPNILLIMADDLGSIDLNCYGSKDLATPHLDRLANNGIRFTQFYAGAPVCSPSRAALLTGKSNLGAGLPGNVPIPLRDPRLKKGLPSSETTIAEMLKDQGYYTALVGKWHLGHSPDKLPNGQGFDYFFGHQRGCIDNYSHFFYWSGPNTHDLYQNNKEIYRPGQYFPDLMAEEVKHIIDHKKDQPFFIFWAANVPHYPYQGTEKWLEYYKDLPMPRQAYAAFVSSMDERIGWVMDHLESESLLDNTVIIFQSDHGHSFEERAFWGGGNAGPYRGGKFSMFEGGIRVPAIISYPGRLPQNESRDQIASGMDWLPTIAAITGAKQAPDHIEGKNLMPLLLDKNKNSPHDQLHWQTGSYNDQTSSWAVRQGDWKLLGNPRDPNPDWSEEKSGEDFTDKDRLFLVNLAEDINEKKNLARQNPEKLEELLQLHENWLSGIKNQLNIK